MYSTDDLFRGLVGYHYKSSFPSTDLMHEMSHRVSEEFVRTGNGFYFSDGGEKLVADFFEMFGCRGEYGDVFTGMCVYRSKFAPSADKGKSTKSSRRGWLRRSLRKRIAGNERLKILPESGISGISDR